MQRSKKRILLKHKVRVKRPLVGVFLGHPLYGEIEAAARTEPVRGISAFVMELVRYGWRAYREVGSLKDLKAPENSAAVGNVMSKRISAERCAMLTEALNLILERGNSAIIEAVERYLIDKAGKYGDSQKS